MTWLLRQPGHELGLGRVPRAPEYSPGQTITRVANQHPGTRTVPGFLSWHCTLALPCSLWLLSYLSIGTSPAQISLLLPKLRLGKVRANSVSPRDPTRQSACGQPRGGQWQAVLAPVIPACWRLMSTGALDPAHFDSSLVGGVAKLLMSWLATTANTCGQPCPTKFAQAQVIPCHGHYLICITINSSYSWQ